MSATTVAIRGVGCEPADVQEAGMDWRTAFGVIWIAAVLALHLRALVQGIFG